MFLLALLISLLLISPKNASGATDQPDLDTTKESLSDMTSEREKLLSTTVHSQEAQSHVCQSAVPTIALVLASPHNAEKLFKDYILCSDHGRETLSTWSSSEWFRNEALRVEVREIKEGKGRRS